MTKIQSLIQSAEEKLSVKFSFLKKASETTGEETAEAEKTGTLFSFQYGNDRYIGAVKGKDKEAENYAVLLPSYLESFLMDFTKSKDEEIRELLLSSTPDSAYKFLLRYALPECCCCAIVLKFKKSVSKDTETLITQFCGNGYDLCIRVESNVWCVVHFLTDGESDYRSLTEFSQYLAEFLKEELGTDCVIGIGSSVKDLSEISNSYERASGALRNACIFSQGEGVHSYKEYMLIEMLEEIPEKKLNEYLTLASKETVQEIFEDEEMVRTAEAFLENDLNVSETSRKVYMHRNTLLYRLDKIEKTSGLNIRSFSDAVTFRILTVLYKLTKSK